MRIPEGRPPRPGGRTRLVAASVATLVAGFVLSCASGPAERASAPHGREPFSPSRECASCHTALFEQHAESMHARSWINPVVQAQLYKEYVDPFHDDLAGFRKEPPCMACHAPMAYVEAGYWKAKEISQKLAEKKDCSACHSTAGQASGAAAGAEEGVVEDAPAQAESAEAPRQWRLTYVNEQTKALARSGVGCDACHTMVALPKGEVGGGRYVSTPGQPKYGPFPYAAGTWHRAYGVLQTKSEMCGACHEAENRFGVPIRTTFTEWKASPQAAEGIQCQDCHMTAGGFLMDGRAIHESGQAAVMPGHATPEREKLYTHRFVGAHSRQQVDGAIGLALTAADAGLKPGGTLEIRVAVDNSRSGHSFPTGSPELRSLWLDVTAEVGGKTVRATAVDAPNSYGLAGGNAFDEEAFGKDLVRGARVYRSVFLDSEGQETLTFFNAAERAFDNRLKAGEARPESFRLVLPADASGDVTLRARLTYVRYPEAFVKRLGVKPFAPVVVAEAEKKLRL